MKKAHLTRRDRALGWCAAAALLAVCAWMWLPGSRTLAAAHRRAVGDFLAFPAETLCEVETDSGTWLILSQNADAVCLGRYYKAGWLNWRCEYLWPVLERDAGRPFAAGSDRVTVEEGRGYDRRVERHYVFGCVWDPAVETVEIFFHGENSEEQVSEQTVRLDVAAMERDSQGEKWFFQPMDPIKGIVSWTSSVTGYDGQGRVLGRQYVSGLGRWEDEL